jgi:hypothetical protein
MSHAYDNHKIDNAYNEILLIKELCGKNNYKL